METVAGLARHINMDEKPKKKLEDGKDPKIGQGFNDARGDFPDHYDVPKNNGLNVNNDPAHQREKEEEKKSEKKKP